MVLLTGEEVVSAVAINVRAACTTTELKQIYKNKPMQKMEKPCAFIHQIESDFNPELRNRGEMIYMIDVRCHPLDTNTTLNTWCRSLATKLIDALEYITISSQKVKAYSIQQKEEDGVLHIITSYSFKVRKYSADIPEMLTTTITERVK